MVAVIIIVVVIVVLGIILGAMYNGLVRLNQQASEAWSDITVQLKRRYDLIPNLVNTVKGYASHEKTVFEDVTAARANALGAQTVADTAKAENQFQQTMKSLFAVAENYPDLKASQNFQELQAELTDTEDKIQASRRFYNGVVRDFNTRRTTFPTNLLASMFGFRQNKEYFEVDESQVTAIQNPVNVQF
ncbi:MAG TPA: LemA family protein [Candidatus Saccharimonadales bacterium]|nr:LemA family protein [Candidatus Saccharimonadales bacterium]